MRGLGTFEVGIPHESIKILREHFLVCESLCPLSHKIPLSQPGLLARCLGGARGNLGFIYRTPSPESVLSSGKHQVIYLALFRA